MKAILFDLDRTLLDVDPVYKKCYAQMNHLLTEQTGLNLSDEEFNKRFHNAQKRTRLDSQSWSRILFLQYLVEDLEIPFSSKLVLDLWDIFIECIQTNLKASSDIIDFLTEIKKIGLKIAIVSNGTVIFRLIKISNSGLDPYIDAIVSREEVGVSKPHSYIFYYAMRKLGVSPNECIMVGNSISQDILGAKRLGIRSVLFTRFKDESALLDKSEYKFVSPDLVTNNFDELLDWIKKMQ